jgi:NADPH:quinone reductase-like Zn-dependent oxidoreductase
MRAMAMHWVATDFGGLDVLNFQPVDVPEPGPGEVSIDVHAAGMNPADFKHIAREGDRSRLPIPIGYEVSGVIAAIGPGTQIASGGGAVGDEVLAFRVTGGYATAVIVPVPDVFAKPASLSHREAASLLLAGTTAAEMLHVARVAAGDTIVVHGASGAVGVSVLQQAALLGARAIGTASETRFAKVQAFGGEPVAYGDGLEQRLRDLAPAGYAAALDTIGADEVVDASLAIIEDRSRVVTIAAFDRAKAEGFSSIGGAMPSSAAYRDANRARLIDLAADGRLVVPVARTFPLADAIEALEMLKGGHPGGKLALIP